MKAAQMFPFVGQDIPQSRASGPPLHHCSRQQENNGEQQPPECVYKCVLYGLLKSFKIFYQEIDRLVTEYLYLKKAVSPNGRRPVVIKPL